MNKWFLLLLLLGWMFFIVECLSVTKAFFRFFWIRLRVRFMWYGKCYMYLGLRLIISTPGEALKRKEGEGGCCLLRRIKIWN